MASWYRKFIRRFAEITKPLHDLLKKDADVLKDWTAVHDEAIESLKQSLISAPVLAHDDGICPIELHADASYSGLFQT